MNNEDLVSLELAKKLKACGFNEPCQHYYDTEDAPVGHYWRKVISISRNYNEDILKFSAPTLYAAQKWLREKKQMFVNSFPERFNEDTEVKGIYKELLTGMWGYELWDDRNRSNPILEEVDGFHSYEQALSAGISASIDLLAGKEDEE